MNDALRHARLYDSGLPAVSGPSSGHVDMAIRLMALDEGQDIPLDRAMVVVGRHPQCDARLDSLRVSRHHCCMTREKDEVLVRDLGSTNGIRINGQRVEAGRLKPGDELSIAHIRYKLQDSEVPEATIAGPNHTRSLAAAGILGPVPERIERSAMASALASEVSPSEDPLAAAVRNMLPPGLAEGYRIQVIVQLNQKDQDQPGSAPPEAAEDGPHDEQAGRPPEDADACRPASSR